MARIDQPRFEFFAVCPPGIEEVCRKELADLGINDARAVPGGVLFEAALPHLYRVNYWSRTCSRVLCRVGGAFQAPTFQDLVSRSMHLPWSHFISKGDIVRIRASCHGSALYHQEAVADRVAWAIRHTVGATTAKVAANADRAMPRPRMPAEAEDDIDATVQAFTGARAGDPGVLDVFVRLSNNACRVSVDSSGAHLHRRGYRLMTAKAPMRENLAAGLLLAARYDPSKALIDPMCGSGTLPIEAAMIAKGIAPGANRRFALTNWPIFQRSVSAVEQQKEQQPRASSPTAPAPIVASDRDAGAVASARANAERVGVADLIQFRTCSISDVQQPTAQGLLISNMPYGKSGRLGGSGDARNLYAQLGNVVRAKLPRWRVAVVAGSLLLANHIRLKFDSFAALSKRKQLQQTGLTAQANAGSTPSPSSFADLLSTPQHPAMQTLQALAQQEQSQSRQNGGALQLQSPELMKPLVPNPLWINNGGMRVPFVQFAPTVK